MENKRFCYFINYEGNIDRELPLLPKEDYGI